MGRTRIVLLTASSLCNNPRGMKEAAALARSGYEVHIIGAWLEPDLKARDLPIIEQAPFRFVPVFDCTLTGFRGAAAYALGRAQRQAANAVHGWTGWESPHQLGLGFGIERLFAYAKDLPADLYIAHTEPCLYVGRRLMRDGRRIGVDMEDWFSENLLPEARKGRPLRLLHQLERELLVAGAYASCPSRAMSEALSAAYGCTLPAVVYNAFPLVERHTIDGLRKDRRDGAVVSICWYSQTLGPGRGLEDLLAALPLLKRDIEVHIRGRAAPGMEEWMRTRIPERWQKRVFFHPQVANDELLSRVAEHDIGFAGEMKYCRSRDLTVTNKILHYLLGGLAVVASNTSGQREVAMQAGGAVTLYESGNPTAVASIVDELVDSPHKLARAKSAALQAAKDFFCWEHQEGILLQAVAAALAA